jgi:hypothetical protein
VADVEPAGAKEAEPAPLNRLARRPGLADQFELVAVGELSEVFGMHGGLGSPC